jgi:predicted nucleic acid-binding protein
MKSVFADSFFFFAYLNAEDPAHEAAAQYFETFDGQVVTTEWVLTELADGMAGPGDRETFVEFYAAFSSDPSVTVIPSGPGLFAEGLALYSSRKDKDWSLTDCISFVVMKRQSLGEALTGDHHFKQAGFTVLLAHPTP